MPEHVSAIMLAGTILPTPFQEALGIPVLCLPIGPAGCVLDAWIRSMSTAKGLTDVELVVKSPVELERVSAAVRGLRRSQCRLSINPQRDPGAWRGVAGLLRDLVNNNTNGDDCVLVLEAHSYPPKTLSLLMDAINNRPDVVGVVGVSDRGEPAGAYVFRARAFDSVPAVGYCDLKEQLLPALHEQGEKVIVQNVTDRVQRMRDLPTYLKAVRNSLQPTGQGGQAAQTMKRIAPTASISPSAILDGCCIIEPDVVIEDGAVVHDSVVLNGAVVGGGAVVSRSVLGPTVRIKPRTQVVHDVIPTASDRLDDVLNLIENAAGVSAA